MYDIMNKKGYLPTIFSLSILVIAGCSLVAQTPRNSSAQPVGDAAKKVKEGERGSGVPNFWVRPGYRVELLVDNVNNARFLEFGDKGVLYLSRPSRGDILSYRWQNGKLEPLGTFVSGYPTVHGLHFADGWLWFTQTGAIHKGRDTSGDGKADSIETVIPEGDLPKGGGHWWRPVLVTQDSIYTSIGDSGNINDETKTDRQKIWRFDKSGKNKQLFSTGIRNTEKLRLRPGTQEVWGCDHGSDWFGGPIGDKIGKQPITDDNPPDELNHYQEGKFYGHPFVTGHRIPRVEHFKREDIIDLVDQTELPDWKFGAHWAVNGFTFLTKGHFGQDHDGDLFAALHGSWNRKTPDGYHIERVLFDKVTGKPYGGLKIVGCYVNGKVLARPVDCVEAPDGSILFSCDSTGRIYRISAVR